MTREDTSADVGTNGVVRRAMSWLRAGYPDGVPQQDYVALLGVLRRSLTDTELEQVVEGLMADVADDRTLLTSTQVVTRISDVLKGPVLDADVLRVSGQLAAAGWPLADLQARPGLRPEAPAPRATLVSRAVEWLRGGYPAGLPEQDYIPLLALLRRRLTDAEVVEVGQQLIRDGVLAPDHADIGASILAITEELPDTEDVDRVRRYLDGRGWPPELSH